MAFIDSSCDNPGPTSPLFTLWQRNNAMVLSWLLNSFSDNIWSSVLYFETTLKLWKDLEERKIWSIKQGEIISGTKGCILSVSRKDGHC